MSYDKRWHDIAYQWLIDTGLSKAEAEFYQAKLAQELQDCAEDFITDVEEAKRPRTDLES